MRISDWSSDVCSSDLYWNKPEHITKWCQASDDWHAPYAENDLRDGGKFKTTMAAKDGSFSFDFEGVYDEVAEHSNIAYTMAAGRKVKITFSEAKAGTRKVENFNPDEMNYREMQQTGGDRK